jgi:hypothetical protein
MRALLFVALLMTSPALAQTHRPHSEASVWAYLQNRLRDAPGDRDSRYVLAWVDLNGDGRNEAVARIMSRGTCGTGGCNMYVLSPHGRRWSLVGRMTITRLPVRVLNSRTRGWRDLGVHQSYCCEGGRFASYEALIPFDGRTYPSNPSMTPSRRLRRPAAGRVLISDEDRGRPFFPRSNN